jgi:hypothetical protein
MQNLNLLIESTLFPLPVLLVYSIIVQKRKERRKRSRVPFDELRRRPAGEALRIKLEGLDEKINDTISIMVFVPVLSMFAVFILHPQNLIVPVILFFITCITTAIFGIRLFRLSVQRANHQLGYDGERFVGEELSRLIALGFEVYHDVPFDKFNIDHVPVGSRGVFAVETKTRRKPVRKGRAEVHYDGKVLQWPWGKDSREVEQARNNARDLGDWLTSSTGEKVHATPILTIPGWWVEGKDSTASIYVLNPKEIYRMCASMPDILPDAQITRIYHQLNQKCRIEVKQEQRSSNPCP